MRELVGEPEPERSRFVAGLSLLPVLPPDEAITLLESRLVRLDADLVARREELAGWRADVARILLVEVECDIAVRTAEAGWVRALLAELTAGTFPELRDWHAWHEGGATTDR